ncbi:MAG: hypothetical protein LBE30_07120 [Comamonas sp.]|jgi:hemerythrin|nr:hypothetical protein [Comamonas sp.]
MDELHQEFVELIALLQTAEDSELPRLLQAMQTHLQHHFAEEDGWMLSTSFPAARLPYRRACSRAQVRGRSP